MACPSLALLPCLRAPFAVSVGAATVSGPCASFGALPSHRLGSLPRLHGVTLLLWYPLTAVRPFRSIGPRARRCCAISSQRPYREGSSETKRYQVSRTSLAFEAESNKLIVCY